MIVTKIVQLVNDVCICQSVALRRSVVNSNECESCKAADRQQLHSLTESQALLCDLKMCLCVRCNCLSIALCVAGVYCAVHFACRSHEQVLVRMWHKLGWEAG